MRSSQRTEKRLIAKRVGHLAGAAFSTTGLLTIGLQDLRLLRFDGGELKEKNRKLVS
jgi:hypothetical protein